MVMKANETISYIRAQALSRTNAIHMLTNIILRCFWHFLYFIFIFILRVFSVCLVPPSQAGHVHARHFLAQPLAHTLPTIALLILAIDLYFGVYIIISRNIVWRHAHLSSIVEQCTLIQMYAKNRISSVIFILKTKLKEFSFTTCAFFTPHRVPCFDLAPENRIRVSNFYDIKMTVVCAIEARWLDVAMEKLFQINSKCRWLLLLPILLSLFPSSTLSHDVFYGFVIDLCRSIFIFAHLLAVERQYAVKQRTSARRRRSMWKTLELRAYAGTKNFIVLYIS